MTDQYRPRRGVAPDRPGRRWPAVVAASLVLVVGGGVGGYLLFRPPVQAATPAATPAASPAASPGQPSASLTPTPSSTHRSATSVQVKSVANFRDVAGDGIPLTGDTPMALGVVYRSGKLTGLSTADARALRQAGLSDIYDLRTPDVAGRSPDPEIAGATHHLVNLYATQRSTKPSLTSVEAAKQYMRSLNQSFVRVPAQRARTAEVLRDIARADHPVLVHCTEGKDRTGWISALLQIVAGASRETVAVEYLRSNQERAAEISQSYASVERTSGVRAAEIDRALKTVDITYLNAAFDEAVQRYGSLDAFLHKGLGLNDATLTALAARLRGERR